MFFSSFRLATGCFLLLFTTGVSAFSYTLSVSEQALQDHLSAIKPMEKRSHLYRISLSYPQVDLIEGSDKKEKEKQKLAQNERAEKPKSKKKDTSPKAS